MEVRLWAASARDTDSTAKLVDVHLDGYAHNVSEGIVRARYRNCDYLESWLTAGAAHDYTIDLGYTATVFRAGHRIRLEISSSNFPHFDRNPNTGAPFAGRGVADGDPAGAARRPAPLAARAAGRTGRAGAVAAPVDRWSALLRVRHGAKGESLTKIGTIDDYRE